MLLQRHDYDLQHNIPSGQMSTMRVVQNAAMFDALAGLYSDPIEAIVREVCTNALEVGFFRVALPNSLEPCFVVSDDGPGMSHEFMMDGYCAAGYSTKSNSNDNVGGFGLGRLSALAYTGQDDKYTITTNGRTYVVFRNSQGVPTVAFISEGEGTGTTVRVPVRRDDFGKFEQAVKRVLRWFPQDKFELFGTELDPVVEHVRTDKYVQLGRRESHNYILVGPIAYRVDWYRIEANLPTTVVPIFKVGEIDLPPSREAVKYTDRTIAALKKRYQEVAAELAPRILRSAMTMSPKERLELVENLRAEGMEKIFETYHKERGHRAKDAADRKTWKGELYGFKPKWGQFLLWEHENLLISRGRYASYDRTRRYSDNIVSNKPSYYTDLQFTSPSDFGRYAIFVKDDPKLARIADRINASGKRGFNRYYVVDETPTLEGLNVFNLSEFEPPTKAKTRARMKHWIAYTGHAGWVEQATAELPECGIYVPFENNDPVYDGKISFATLLDTPWGRQAHVYGLHKTAQAKVDLKNFTRLDQHLVEMAKPYLDAMCDAQAAIECLKAANYHLLFKVIASENGHVLEDARLAYDEVCAVRDIVPVDARRTIHTLVSMGLIPEIKPSRRKFSLLKQLERAAKKNPALVFMAQHGNIYWNSEGITAQLKEIVK